MFCVYLDVPSDNSNYKLTVFNSGIFHFSRASSVRRETHTPFIRGRLLFDDFIQCTVCLPPLCRVVKQDTVRSCLKAGLIVSPDFIPPTLTVLQEIKKNATIKYYLLRSFKNNIGLCFFKKITGGILLTIAIILMFYFE